MVRGRQRVSRHQLRRRCVARCSELRPIRGRLVRQLNLCRYGSRSRIVHHRQFLRRRPRTNTSAAAVIAYAIALAIRHRIVINIMDIGDIYIVDRAIVSQCAVIPVRAVVAAPRVSKSIVNTTVEADGLSPIPTVPAVIAAVETPVRRCPESVDPRRHHPHARNPVVIRLLITPIAGRPLIIVTGALRLAVFRKWRRGLGRLHILFLRVRTGIAPVGRRIVLVIRSGIGRRSLCVALLLLRLGRRLRRIRRRRGGRRGSISLLRSGTRGLRLVRRRICRRKIPGCRVGGLRLHRRCLRSLIAGSQSGGNQCDPHRELYYFGGTFHCA